MASAVAVCVSITQFALVNLGNFRIYFKKMLKRKPIVCKVSTAWALHDATCLLIDVVRCRTPVEHVCRV